MWGGSGQAPRQPTNYRPLVPGINFMEIVNNPQSRPGSSFMNDNEYRPPTNQSGHYGPSFRPSQSGFNDQRPPSNGINSNFQNPPRGNFGPRISGNNPLHSYNRGEDSSEGLPRNANSRGIGNYFGEEVAQA